MTLEELLISREKRVRRQSELLSENAGMTLLCLTVQLPGPVKRNEISLVIAKSGVEAVRESFDIEYEELRDLETGFEGYFLVPLPPLDAKRLACSIEDSHPLGRLMDIDVIVPGTDGAVPLGRDVLELPSRKCLLCDRPARECMRSRAHSTEDLLAKIEEMVREYPKS